MSAWALSPRPPSTHACPLARRPPTSGCCGRCFPQRTAEAGVSWEGRGRDWKWVDGTPPRRCAPAASVASRCRLIKPRRCHSDHGARLCLFHQRALPIFPFRASRRASPSPVTVTRLWHARAIQAAAAASGISSFQSTLGAFRLSSPPPSTRDTIRSAQTSTTAGTTAVRNSTRRIDAATVIEPNRFGYQGTRHCTGLGKAGRSRAPSPLQSRSPPAPLSSPWWFLPSSLPHKQALGSAHQPAVAACGSSVPARSCLD